MSWHIISCTPIEYTIYEGESIPKIKILRFSLSDSFFLICHHILSYTSLSVVMFSSKEKTLKYIGGIFPLLYPSFLSYDSMFLTLLKKNCFVLN